MANARLTELVEGYREDMTGYLAQIDSDHAYIHKGWAFTAIVNTGSISAAYDIAFTTPAESTGRYVHWRPTGITTSAEYVDVSLYEGDTFSGGTAVTPINRHRGSSLVSVMPTVVKGATATPTGTLLQSFGIGTAGNPSARTGGGGGAELELLLKPGTNYVLTITPDGATTCVLELYWYEEPGA